MQDNLEASVIEENIRPVIRLRADPLVGDGCANLLRHTEKLQSLVDQVRAKIKPKAASGTRPFAPPVANVRAKAIHAGFDVQDLPEDALLDNVPHRQKIAVPATVVENR